MKKRKRKWMRFSSVEEIKKQKDRIGGRNAVHKVFGLYLIFYVLSMSKECIFKRMATSHGKEHAKDMEKVNNLFINLYQKAEDDEEGAINVCITEVKI